MAEKTIWWEPHIAVRYGAQ